MPAGLLDDHAAARPGPRARPRDRARSRLPLGDEHVARKSPKPRVRHTRGRARRARRADRHRSQSSMPPKHRLASPSSLTPETRSRRGSAPSPSAVNAPGAARCPPAAVKRRRRDDADGRGSSVVLESDQRRPHRDAADVALGPVDRIDDPAPVGVGRGRGRRTPRRRSSPPAGRRRAARGARARRRVSASVTGVRSGLVSTTSSSAR